MLELKAARPDNFDFQKQMKREANILYTHHTVVLFLITLRMERGVGVDTGVLVLRKHLVFFHEHGLSLQSIS